MSSYNLTSKVIYGFAIASPACAALLIGGAVRLLVPLYKHHYYYLLGGKQLPMLTESVLTTAETISPATFGLILAALIISVSVSLVYFAKDSHSACHRLLCSTVVAWVIVFLLLMTVCISFGLPFVTINYRMQ